jgi:hypothetical protein
LAVKRPVNQTHTAATEKVDDFVFSNAIYIWSSHENHSST